MTEVVNGSAMTPVMQSIYDCFAGVQKHSNTGRETSVFSQKNYD